jgi:predicted Zn-dependent protease
MFNLFIQTNPDSQLAKLFQIKVALNQNNLSLAEDNLDILMKKYPQKGRIILLFVSSLLTGDFKQSSSNTLSQFGDYVIDNYSAYPEANLLAVVSYANANNSSSLANRLDMIQQKFPNWDIPTIWSVGLLVY